EVRLTQLTRILRALAHPDIIAFEQEETIVEAQIYLPCPEGGIELTEPDTSGPYLVTDVACAESKKTVIVEGYQLPPGSKGPIHFITASGAKLQLGNFVVDGNGTFRESVQMPTRQPVAEAQYLRATARVPVGAPKLTATAIITWDKIIETVFLALLATTFGTLLAIPISFLAARNLMSEIKYSLTSVALTIIGWPLGIGLGFIITRWLGRLSELLSANIMLNVGGLIITPVLAFALIRWALPKTGLKPSGLVVRTTRILVYALTTASGIIFLQLLTTTALTVGQALIEPLGPLGFLGGFISQLGDVINMITPAVIALAGGAVVGSPLSSLGQRISDRYSEGSVKIINYLLSAIAGALLFIIVGAVINWFYQINDPLKVLIIPGGVGALLGFLFALRSDPKDLIPIGSTIYIITRTILNSIRSVEPLIMVIVFAVWVGIGPFAGVLALGLHTIAALAKLYSEQVESIMPGPLEAVQATGANRLQTIVFAVVPQIVPPYISFTMYRWDINVRMSTIIGFAGGGGIGFLLMQNINLLNYRAASTQMLAIAVVVASMDYISSTLRKRLV
ncbi:MAG: ABC transporter permease subunit, partial [Anaerolineales bacterium]|nr:ABC transporter permease subunit [Anaerolineales bacterium]